MSSSKVIKEGVRTCASPSVSTHVPSCPENCQTVNDFGSECAFS